MVLVPQVEGTEVITVEGLSQNGELDSLQQSFIKIMPFNAVFVLQAC